VAEPKPGLSTKQKEGLADLLSRYARAVSGPPHDRIVAYFDGDGTVTRERSVLAAGRPAWRRATAAFRLGDIGTPAVAPELIRALTDPDLRVRIAAARSLGRLRAPEAVEGLVAAAANGHVPDALGRWALLRIGSPALPRLRAMRATSNPRERAGAIQLVGLLGGPADAVAVQERLRDSSALVRVQAALALGRLGGEQNLRALIDALEDRIPTVQEAAATALGTLRDPSSVDALVAHAQGDQFEVARASARAVAAIDAVAAGRLGASTGSVHLLEAADLASLS